MSKADDLGVRRHPAGSFNDEPILAAALEMHGLSAATLGSRQVFALGSFGTGSMGSINVRRRRSRHRFADQEIEPVAIHFNVESQRSQVYDRELRRLEMGRFLGCSPLPGLVSLGSSVATTVTASDDHGLRTVRAIPRKAAARVLRQPRVARRLPVRVYERVTHPGVADLVEKVAGRRLRPFRFVQVGSNDGRTGDPLHETVMRRRVRGILIEPVPFLFERLQRTYEGKPGLRFANVAIAAEAGPRELYWVPPRPGDPIWAEQLGSLRPEVVLSHHGLIDEIDERLETVVVDCKSLGAVIEEHGVGRLDLLHIDAEGSDYEILSSVDFDAPWAPRFILYEQKHLGDRRSDAIELVHRAGYRTIDMGMDVFAYRGPLRHAYSRVTALVSRSGRPQRT